MTQSREEKATVIRFVWNCWLGGRGFVNSLWVMVPLRFLARLLTLGYPDREGSLRNS